MAQSKVELNGLLEAALEEFGGGFSLMRAVRADDGEIADWQLLHANEYVRARWGGLLPAAGASMATLMGHGVGLHDICVIQLTEGNKNPPHYSMRMPILR